MRWCVLLVFVGVTALAAQTRDVHRERIDLALSATEPDRETLKAVKSARVERALRSPELLWEFVTSPEPMYLERRAVAVRARGVVPLSWLPRLWRTIGELRRASDGWRIQTHLLSSMIRSSGPLPPPVERRVLGHIWKPPAQLIEYPLTPGELERAPWPWQVLLALGDLAHSLSPSGQEDVSVREAEKYLNAALAIPCGTDEDAELFMEALSNGYYFKTIAAMASLRRIALNPSLRVAPGRAIDAYAEATQRAEMPRPYWIGSAGVLDILRQSTSREVRLFAASKAPLLLESFSGAESAKRPLPAAIVLEMSRKALDPATGSVSSRHAYAVYVSKMVDDPPINPNVDPSESTYDRRLREFGVWFQSHRRALEDLAAQQKPQVDEARRLLANAPTCH